MKISQIGILTASVAWLLLSMVDAWAIEDIVKDIVDQRDRTPFEQTVAETLTFEEYAEWLSIRQKFEAKENNEKERQMQCVANGGHPQICVDPHWCLYPSNEKKSECVKYYVKLGLF